MNSLLLFISFIIHIITITAIFLLYQQLQTIKGHREQQVESMLEQFIDEVREENERLRRTLTNERKLDTFEISTETKTYKKNHPTLAIKERVNEDESAQYINKQLTQIKDRKDQVETSLESQILQLHEEGLSHEEIAKKVNRGKTEVELFLKMLKHK